MKISSAVILMMLLGTTAMGAQQRIVLNNIYPLQQENFELSDGIFHVTDNQGYFEVVEGPMEAGPVRCVGSGFGYRDGTNSINGICIFGAGEDRFTMRWKAGEKGGPNTWTIAAGTGKFAGMTGEGIATTGIEVVFKAMPLRETRIVGTIDIPD